MADPKIRIRRSATPNKVPDTSQLQLGELAINTFDGKLYLEQDQTSGSGIATVIAVNPWNVGLGTLAYDTYFTAGNVGVGTTNPTQLLDVAGDIRLRGAIYDSLNSTGTSNQVLVSNAGAGVTWKTLSAIPVGDANTLDGLDSTQFLRSDVADIKVGITTFSDDVILQSNLNVTGVSTFTGNANFQNVSVGGTLEASGLTTTTNLYVSSGSTFNQITVSGISPDGSDFGTNNYVPLADGSGGWSWQPVSAASGGGGGNITVREEGSTVGTANSISVLNFVGNNITANAVALGVAATITVSDTPTFDSLSVTGVSTLSSAIVGTSVTITSSGLNVTGVVTATSFVGDGSGLSNLPGASVGISTNTTDQSQLLTFATGYGSTTGLGATDGLVYNPSSGRLGIGSATPAYTLDVAGDINSSTDVKIDGTGVLDTALALAIALG